jgi:hypothetical protein
MPGARNREAKFTAIELEETEYIMDSSSIPVL